MDCQAAGLRRHDELLVEMDVTHGWDDLRAITVRTLAVAGTRQDDVDCTKRSGLLRRVK